MISLRSYHVNRRGFTLIELLIVVSIIGILAAVAYPAYTDSVVRSNRSEGQRELLRIANLQEQYFTDNRTYTTDMTELGLDASPFITENKHYSISATVTNGGTQFTLKAAAKGSQATTDKLCPTLTITETGEKTPATGCWEN